MYDCNKSCTLCAGKWDNHDIYDRRCPMIIRRSFRGTAATAAVYVNVYMGLLELELSISPETFDKIVMARWANL